MNDVVLYLQPKKKKRITQKIAKKYMFVGAMLAWPLLHFLIFWLYVNVDSIRMAFMLWDPQTATYQWNGFDRFRDILDSIFVNPDASIINYIKNSLLVFPVNNLIMLPLSFTLAFFMAKKVPLGPVFRIVFFLPSILSTVVMAMSYRYMFHPDFGPVDSLLVKIFGSTPDWFDTTGNTAMGMVFFFTVWSGLGYKMLLLEGAIERIPQEVIEAGKLDGITLFREMISVTLPLVMPTMTTFIITNTLGVFGYFLDPMLLCGEDGGAQGATGTIALRVVGLMQRGNGEDAAAFGLMFSVIGVPFILFIKWLLEKITPDVQF